MLPQLLCLLPFLLLRPTVANDLITAARDNDLPVFQTAIQLSSADINGQNDAGGTALQWASYHGNFEMVDALVSSGADIDLGNTLGYTPLIQSIMNNHPAVALYLIREKADVSRMTEDTHSTALHYGSWHGSSMHNVVESLIDSGANMMASDKHGHRPISIANGEGHRAVRDMIGRRSGETL